MKRFEFGILQRDLQLGKAKCTEHRLWSEAYLTLNTTVQHISSVTSPKLLKLLEFQVSNL